MMMMKGNYNISKLRGLGDVPVVVNLSRVHIIHQYVDVFVVMLRQEWLSVHEVSLKLWVFNVKNLRIELLQVRIGELIDVQSEPVTEDYLELLGPNVAAPVDDLSLVGADVSWLLTVLVAVLSKDLRDVVGGILLSLGVFIRIVLQSYLPLLSGSPVLKRTNC